MDVEEIVKENAKYVVNNETGEVVTDPDVYAEDENDDETVEFEPTATERSTFELNSKRDFGLGVVVGVLIGAACYKLVDAAVESVKKGVQSLKKKAVNAKKKS